MGQNRVITERIALPKFVTPIAKGDIFPGQYGEGEESFGNINSESVSRGRDSAASRKAELALVHHQVDATPWMDIECIS
jgi:hypothetical protein